jgi:hypothetical protein
MAFMHIILKGLLFLLQPSLPVFLAGGRRKE